jgi:hypothetical protein
VRKQLTAGTDTMIQTLYSISSDITESYLRTETSTIDIDSPSYPITIPTVSWPRNPQYQGPGVSTDSI